MGGIIKGAAKVFSLDDEKEPEKRPVVPGEVEKSIVLARSNLIRNQKKAAMNLHRLASDSDHIRYLIVQEGGVVPLINMFKAKSSEVQEYCLRALGEVIKIMRLNSIDVIINRFVYLALQIREMPDSNSRERWVDPNA